jgi:hypothetical protein
MVKLKTKVAEEIAEGERIAHENAAKNSYDPNAITLS